MPFVRYCKPSHPPMCKKKINFRFCFVQHCKDVGIFVFVLYIRPRFRYEIDPSPISVIRHNFTILPFVPLATQSNKIAVKMRRKFIVVTCKIWGDAFKMFTLSAYCLKSSEFNLFSFVLSLTYLLIVGAERVIVTPDHTQLYTHTHTHL